MKLTAAVVVTLTMWCLLVFAQQARNDGFEIDVLSTHADMVSGGDVLIQIAVPASIESNVEVLVNGQIADTDVKPANPASRTRIVRVNGLQPGKSNIEVGMKGQKPAARLTVVNHPIEGPVLSGPHQTPFKCETEAYGYGPPLDGNCTIATRIEYFYRSAESSTATPVKPYDLNGPKPADLATTTTVDGKTVPYIVRREVGTINRALYAIAFLHEPGTPLPDPWSTDRSSWNGRLVYSFGAGCQAGYHQGLSIGGLIGNRRLLEETQLGDYAIAKGYAVAASSLNAFGTNCSDVISAEAMMMVKEHFIEQYGMPRYTIGSGRSGGSMQQHLIANNYPGLLDGLIPTASFADTLTFINHVSDCELLDQAFMSSSLKWTDDQKRAVSGESSWQYCAENGEAFLLLRPYNCNRTTLSSDETYSKSNPKGVRCTYQDNLVNVFGRDPKTGLARRPFDNVGIQYGLKALNDGKISAEQFIDLNRRIGGHDIDGNVVASRTVADRDALRIAFQSGRVNDTSAGMAMTPIIDVRPYTEGSGDVHDTVNSQITRARLVAAHGTSGNQVLHTYEPGTDIQRVQRDNLDEMDQWLAAIVRDTAPAKNALDKVIRNRPTTVTDACYTKDGQKITDMRRCAQMFPVYSTPRLNAGLPIGATTLKCELKAVDRKDYSATLSNAQVAELKAVFPSGVCDYTKKGVAVRPPDTWLAY